MSYDSTADTRDHIGKVQARIHECTNNLIVRAERHDKSKLMEPEKSALDRIGPPGKVAYSRGGEMTPEYQAFLDTLEPMLDHHYAHNSHHPQHYPNGMDGFSLLDLLEWLCDIKAAGERYEGGNIAESMKTNRGRFKISDQVFAILENTVRELGW